MWCMPFPDWDIVGHYWDIVGTLLGHCWDYGNINWDTIGNINWDIVGHYFLDIQLIRLPPKNIHAPVVELLSFGSLIQLESLKATKESCIDFSIFFKTKPF